MHCVCCVFRRKVGIIKFANGKVEFNLELYRELRFAESGLYVLNLDNARSRELKKKKKKTKSIASLGGALHRRW